MMKPEQQQLLVKAAEDFQQITLELNELSAKKDKLQAEIVDVDRKIGNLIDNRKEAQGRMSKAAMGS